VIVRASRKPTPLPPIPGEVYDIVAPVRPPVVLRKVPPRVMGYSPSRVNGSLPVGGASGTSGSTRESVTNSDALPRKSKSPNAFAVSAATG